MFFIDATLSKDSYRKLSLLQANLMQACFSDSLYCFSEPLVWCHIDDMAIDNSNGGDIITSMISGGDACVGHLQVRVISLEQLSVRPTAKGL